jgi:hypothetical protein
MREKIIPAGAAKAGPRATARRSSRFSACAEEAMTMMRSAAHVRRAFGSLSVLSRAHVVNLSHCCGRIGDAAAPPRGAERTRGLVIADTKRCAAQPCCDLAGQGTNGAVTSFLFKSIACCAASFQASKEPAIRS